MGFLDFVRSYLIAKEATCYRHCQDPSRFATIYEQGNSLVGAYVCPGNYVSRVVYFSDSPNRAWFWDFLSSQIGDTRLRERDIRMATRHGWELDPGAEALISVVSPESQKIMQYYWTVYPQNENEKKVGTFLCSREKGGCNKLFNKTMADISTELCPKCTEKT